VIRTVGTVLILGAFLGFWDYGYSDHAVSGVLAVMMLFAGLLLIAYARARPEEKSSRDDEAGDHIFRK
jgi:cbb3-type cytochrome oxidase subunit 3